MSIETSADQLYDCQVLVIGSGVSGYCAAIQAGREGCGTVLIEKDEVLGGNSGPNLGVGITGADRYNAFATETGLIQELQEEAAWVEGFTRISAGTMPYNISRRNEAVIQSALEKAGVRLLKRHYARKPIVEDGCIIGVIVEDIASFRTVEIRVNGLVIEASGDGQIGALAGAEFDSGSESQGEFGERSAPSERRSWVQGTSLVAIAQRTGSPVEFIPPPGTPEFTPRLWHGSIGSYIRHSHGNFSGDNDLIFLYITEAGGDMDTIREDGEIYELLLKQLWAEWNHVKNGPHREESRDWDLLWVSPKAGKRESRRFLGDLILTQTDLEGGRRFPDDIAYGGHDLDDHQSLGAAGSNIFGHSIPPIYGIPFRSCYSRNIDNLLLAGRLISATHLAHSSTRLMRTGGAIGQAVGLAAALCCRHALTPRQLYQQRLDELQQQLLRRDGSILDRPLDDDGDLARQAAISASSESLFDDQEIEQLAPLVAPAGNILWDWPDRLDQLQFYLRNETDSPQPMNLRLLHARREPKWSTAELHHRHDWNDLRDAAFTTISQHPFVLPPAFEGWFTIPFDTPIDLGAKDSASDADRRLVALNENRQVWWGLSRPPCEIATMVEHSHHDTHWRTLDARGSMRFSPDISLGEATNATNGYHRRFSRGPTNMWISRPDAPPPHELLLQWSAPVRFDRIELTFDNLAPSRAENPWEAGTRILPMLAKEYDLEMESDGKWITLVSERNSIHRFRPHSFPSIQANQLRLIVKATHGERNQARVYQIAVHLGKRD